MADEVVDIRRRITEMRNEVSAAIVSNRDVVAASRTVGNRANISFSQPTSENNKRVRTSDVEASQQNDYRQRPPLDPFPMRRRLPTKALTPPQKCQPFN